jgi:hypothetical protein
MPAAAAPPRPALLPKPIRAADLSPDLVRAFDRVGSLLASAQPAAAAASNG